VRAARALEFDAVTFASPSAVLGFVEIAGTPEELHLTGEHADGPVVACIGPVTARAAAEVGMRVDVVPQRHTIEGLVSSLAGHFA
jgi:uroporphyrinogen III methyltransferase/synthase